MRGGLAQAARIFPKTSRLLHFRYNRVPQSLRFAESGMRAIVSAVMAAMLMGSLAGTPAFAQAALTPGKPAGARAAQFSTSNLILLGGITAVAVAIAIVAADTDNPTSSTSTTS
jgi:hypothetical protein